MEKRDSQTVDFYTAKVQQLSAMGGFPISREIAQQAVTRADARPTPNLTVIRKKIAGKLASSPAYRIAR
jgi:hypothetical protein